MEQKKVTITIIGAVEEKTEDYNERFGQFMTAIWKVVNDTFPEFQLIRPPITVIFDDISPDDLILFPVKEKE